MSSAPRFMPMARDALDAVVALESRVHVSPWSAASFTGALDSGNLITLARDDSGALLGFVVLLPAVDTMELLDISVDLPYQGKGIGRLLMQEAIRQARSQGMAQILLEVRVSNAPAIALYGTCGFREISRRKGYYRTAEGEREDAIIMQLQLTDQDKT